MRDETIDPRFEKLVALLYGELSPEEEREVRNEIASDDELRRAWEDLLEARTALGAWKAEEPVPSFVFLRDEAEAKPRARDLGAPLRKGWRERLRGVVLVPWVTAAAAIVLSLLAIGDFRVVRGDKGWTVGFGASPAPTSPVSTGPGLTSPAPSLPTASLPEVREDLAQPRAETMRRTAAEELAGVPGVGPFLTRDEFEAYAAGVTQTMVALLNTYGRERDREFGEAVEVALTSMAARQTTDYRDLRARLETLQLLMLQEGQQPSRERLGPLPQDAQGDSARPMEDLPGRGSED